MISPLVSVIIPCFNQGHYLSQAIESVCRQTYSPVELIVIDDGSRDNTAQVAARYARVHCIQQANQGLAAARNTGIGASHGDFLVFLDADDRLLPSALATGLACFRAYPECAFVYGAYRHIAPDGQPLQAPRMPQVNHNHYAALLQNNCVQMHATVMYRRERLAAIQGFNPALSASEDYDVYLRLAKHYPVSRHDQLVAEYRLHPDSMSRNAGLMLEMTLTVLASQWPYVQTNDQYRRAYKKGMRFWQHHYGKKLAWQVVKRMLRGDIKVAVRGAQTFFRYVSLVTMLQKAPLWLAELLTLPFRYRLPAQ